MSLVTTCPACSTTFRITPEQLAAHRGDVRCGQCQHIFSALQQLQEIEAAAAAAALRAAETQPEASPSTDAEPAFEKTLVLQEAPILEPLPEQPPAEPAPVPLDPVHVEDAEPEPADVGQTELAEPQASVDFELDFPDSQLPLELEAQAVAAEPVELQAPLAEQAPPVPELPTAVEETPDTPQTPADKPPEAAPAALPDFMQPPRRGAPWWVMLPLVLLLLALAAGQLAYFLRVEISTYFPPARPWLEQGCLLLRCEVGLPRHADLLSIEDSDLQDDPEHPGALILASVLYNRAPYAQAYPKLELTLTDTFDKPVLRRTFQPLDYLPAGSDLKPGIGAGGEIRSRLSLAVSGDKPAGYRLYVRY